MKNRSVDIVDEETGDVTTITLNDNPMFRLFAGIHQATDAMGVTGEEAAMLGVFITECKTDGLTDKLPRNRFRGPFYQAAMMGLIERGWMKATPLTVRLVFTEDLMKVLQSASAAVSFGATDSDQIQ